MNAEYLDESLGVNNRNECLAFFTRWEKGHTDWQALDVGGGWGGGQASGA